MIENLFTLRNKNIVITGASSGIGEALVYELAGLGVYPVRAHASAGLAGFVARHDLST